MARQIRRQYVLSLSLFLNIHMVPGPIDDQVEYSLNLGAESPMSSEDDAMPSLPPQRKFTRRPRPAPRKKEAVDRDCGIWYVSLLACGSHLTCLFWLVLSTPFNLHVRCAVAISSVQSTSPTYVFPSLSLPGIANVHSVVIRTLFRWPLSFM